MLTLPDAIFTRIFGTKYGLTFLYPFEKHIISERRSRQKDQFLGLELTWFVKLTAVLTISLIDPIPLPIATPFLRI